MKIKVRDKENASILDISGKIVAGKDIDKIRNTTLDLLDEGKKNIIFNLAKVPYVDSTGLGEIIRAYITVKKRDGQLRLLKISEKIKDLLTISKLITTFDKNIHDNEEEALKSF